MNVAKITEEVAHTLAQTDLEVFMNDATPAEYITHTGIAEKNLARGQYSVIPLSEADNIAYSQITYHFITYDESSYPVRYDNKPFPIKKSE